MNSHLTTSRADPDGRPLWAALALLIPTLLFVGGCATTVPGDEPESGESVETVPAPAAVEAEQEPEYSDLDPDILYRLLLAEIAGQRGRIDVAMQELAAASWESRDPWVARRATRTALFAKDYDVALMTAERWLELMPADAEARKNVALLNLRKGRSDKAADVMDDLLEQLADSPARRWDLAATMLSREKDRDAAVEVMKLVVARHDADPLAHLALGRLAIVARDLGLARSASERALALDPESTEAKAMLARVMATQGENDAAIALMAEAVDARAEDQSLRMSFARMLLGAGRNDDAREQFERILDNSPDDADTLYALSLLALQNDQYEQAAEFLNRLAGTGERVDEVNYYQGVVAARKEQWSDALSFFAKVGSGDLHTEAMLQAARMSAELGDMDEARARLRTLRASQPELSIRSYLFEGELLRKKGLGEQALAVYHEGVGRHPDSTDLLYARGLLGQALGQSDVLKSDLRRVLELDPDNAHAMNALGYTMADLNENLDEAERLVRKALELAPDEAAIIDSMGWVLFRRGKLEEAEQYLREALSVQFDGEIAAHLGEVLWAQDRKDEARAVFDEARRRDGDNPALIETLKRLEL
ncbi:MAG: tetratricopeptide repeat protein [Gammaproteobacteria bacterium]